MVTKIKRLFLQARCLFILLSLSLPPTTAVERVKPTANPPQIEYKSTNGDTCGQYITPYGQKYPLI